MAGWTDVYTQKKKKKKKKTQAREKIGAVASASVASSAAEATALKDNLVFRIRVGPSHPQQPSS